MRLNEFQMNTLFLRHKTFHMKLRKTTLLYLLIFSAGFMAQSQSYDIRFRIKNFADTTAYLAQYYGDKILLEDTAKVTDGQFAFKGKNKLPDGMYVVAGQSNNKILDVLVNKDQRFLISANINNLLKSISIEGSKENELFYEYINEITKKRKVIQQLKQLPDNQKKKRKIRNINEQVDTYQKNFIKENKGTFAAAFVKASRDIEVPEPDDKNDSTFKYRYYRNHYWDNMDLSDSRLLRTPLFHDRYMRYLDKVVPQHPDSISKALDQMLNAAPDSTEIFKYMLWEATRKYERSKVMGFDAVFTHLALNYFKEGRTADLNEQVVKNIVEKGETLKNLLIGKKAPKLVMMDSTRKPVSLHDIKADYTIVAFWDSNCGHCQKEIPKLHEFYKTNKEKWNLATFAVSTDTSTREWKAFINKNHLTWTNVYGYWSYTKNFHDLYDINSTPVIYLLDEEKKIIGKKITTGQVKEIIRRKESREKK